MRSRTRQAACVAGAGLLALGAVAAVPALSDRIPDPGYLLRDTAVLAEVPWWLGSMSRLTNLVWAAAATLLVVAGLVTPRAGQLRLVSLGALTAFLALDDTLLLHEAALPGRGVPEGVVMAVYGLCGLALGYYWLPVRRTAMGAAFFAGAALLGLSLLLDQALGGQYLLEDGAKLLGVLAWTLCGAWALSDALAHLRSGGPEPYPGSVGQLPRRARRDPIRTVRRPSA